MLNKIYIKILPIFVLLLLISCKTIETKAILASENMIDSVFQDSTNKEFEKYLYVPEKNIVWCRLSVYKNNSIYQNVMIDISTNQSDEYKKIKDNYGDLIDFTVENIKYKHYWFPLWDYGYPHSISIVIYGKYQNINTKEIIGAYYIKQENKIQIVDYIIIEEPIDW